MNANFCHHPLSVSIFCQLVVSLTCALWCKISENLGHHYDGFEIDLKRTNFERV
jgi:hypothetical protein